MSKEEMSIESLEGDQVIEMDINRLRDFKNHPFKVTADISMVELKESIQKFGILNPLIVRPVMEGYYEIISGHRRRYAAKQLGYTKVPVIIKVMRTDEAVVAMVDSNLQLNQLIKENNLPPVVFHSLRHSSVTYKLKLNGGDIKAVQGDSGHAQVSMVTDVYSHILDDDRKKNAELFEEAFYEKKNLDPQMHPNTAENTVTVPEGVDAELLAKVLNNSEMAALLTSLAKTMK